MRHHLLLVITLTAVLLLPPVLLAEEGASGHYSPGMTSDFIDTLPGKPALVIADGFTYYHGNARPGLPIDFGGVPTFGADATLYAESLVGIWETPLRLLGGNYAMAVTVPYVWMEVKGTVAAGPVSTKVRDTANGLGDVSFYPFMLGWTNEHDLKYDLRLQIYTPTGEYDTGQLANVGRNYWTFEPAASISWFSTKIGTEATLFGGFDFNTENHATDYQSGTSVHLDGTVAQHLPLLGGVAGVGANVFYYRQLSDDSGSGANAGDFLKGHTFGVGPVVSYIRKVGGADFAAEVKWLPELDVEKRLKGDFVWVKLGLVF